LADTTSVSSGDMITLQNTTNQQTNMIEMHSNRTADYYPVQNQIIANMT